MDGPSRILYCSNMTNCFQKSVYAEGEILSNNDLISGACRIKIKMWGPVRGGGFGDLRVLVFFGNI